MKRKDYKNYVQSKASRSPILKNCFFAFLTGGAICALGQLLMQLYASLGVSKTICYPLASVTLIFISGLFTGLGLFDKLAKHAGAGTLVPITGFANAITSPAIDAKSEGFVLGVGAKVFVIAGPVIVYGTLASMLYGIIYYLVTL